MRVGQEVQLRATERYVHHVRSHAITDVFDALVELITNSDDSYGRQYQAGQREGDGGVIRIWHRERRGEPSSIAVGDRAEGMDVQAMERGLRDLGSRSSKAGDRGYPLVPDPPIPSKSPRFLGECALSIELQFA